MILSWEVALQVKILADKPHDLSLIPRIHMVEENRILWVAL